MNLNGNPLRLIRNIRRIIDVKKASQRSIKSKSKRTYLLPGLKNTILVIIGIALADTFRLNALVAFHFLSPITRSRNVCYAFYREIIQSKVL